MVLVGNKTDAPGRLVTDKQGLALAKKIHATYVETSAKDAVRV